MKSNNEDVKTQFNLLMVFMPLQSIFLCYLVFDFSVRNDAQINSPLGIIVVLLSIALIFITMIILDKYRKAQMYQKEYELGLVRLRMQIEHYQEFYREQEKVKVMRHEMNNKLVAITGLLNANRDKEAIDQLLKMQVDAMDNEHAVNTGFPPIDAIISTKIVRSVEHGIEIRYTIMIDGDLFVDQFDIAVIVANALDNAIEGILRSTDISKVVKLNISRTGDYISIIVENYASGPIYENFQTSKQDKKNHGFGIAQMNEITLKYDGSFRPSYDPDTRKFSLKIMLKNIR